MKKAIVGLYIIVLFIVIWLIYACNCNLKFGTDGSAGLFITALGVLVTFVVAWQIWQTIDANGRIKKMEASVAESENRDKQLGHLLEAFQIDEIAKLENSPAPKYAQSVNALRSFILAGISSSYIPVKNIIDRLSAILDDIDKDSNRFNRIIFANVNRECDNCFKDILASINKQIEIYGEISDSIKALNKRRININEPYKDISINDALNSLHTHSHL